MEEKKESYLVEDFSICREEFVIYGRCYHPADDPYGRYPGLLLNHEFASNMNSPARYAKKICTLGYHVFVFDFTGSKGTKSFGREDIDCSVLTDKEEMEVVYQYMKEQNYVDEKHLVLGGCSQGGLTAGLLAADHKEEVEAVLMYYPSLCAPDYLRRGYMMGKQFDPMDMPEYIEMYRGTGIGRKYVEDVTVLDPWKELCVFEGPVLICHGVRDSIADISYSRQAAQKYKNCVLYEFESGEHIFKKPENFHSAIDHTITFLKEGIMPCNESKRVI